MAVKPLSKEQLKYYEDMIQKELRESIAYIENINRDQSKGAKESSGDLSSYAFHQADQGSDTNLMEQTVMLLEQERDKIRLLNDAMRRITDGSYGMCEICGCLIQDARLEIIPYARYCIECKEKDEVKGKRKKR